MSTTEQAQSAREPEGRKRGRRALFERSRLGIRDWFYAAIGAMIALVVIFSVIGGVLLARSSQASDTLANRIAPADTALVDMFDALVDEETGVRGFLLSHQSDFLQPYTQGMAQEAADAQQVETLLAGHTTLLADLAAVQRAVDAWRADYATPMLADGRAGRPVSDAELAASKDAFDHLRSVFAKARADLATERVADEAHLNHLYRIRDWALSAMLAAFLLTACLIVALIHSAVIRPLSRLRSAAEAVREGTFDAQITPTGPSDIRELGEALDAMRGRMSRALAVAERQRARVSKQRDQLAEQTDQLDIQAAELRRSNEELEQFAYVASHDLQEPLRKIATFCQLIEKRYGEALDERGKQYIDFAVDGAKRMQVLINDLLGFSRVGRLNARRERVDLQAAVGDAADGLQVALQESDGVIRMERPLPAVMGDPTLLRQLFQNLLGNSLKFRAPDRAPEIEIGWEPDPENENFIRMSLTDNGIGIPPEFAEKVFVIFQRLHSREAYAGTGIGLALCKKIVEYHGGRIGIDPDRETGTRFVLTLPAAEPVEVEAVEGAPLERAVEPPAEQAPAQKEPAPTEPTWPEAARTAAEATTDEAASAVPAERNN